MTQMLYNIGDLCRIGDAIRGKNKSKSKYYLSEMPDKIKALIWRGDIVDYQELETIDPNVLYVIEEEKERYIQPICPVEEDDTDCGYIPVLTDDTTKMVTYGDTLTFDFIPVIGDIAHSPVADNSSTRCFIGGSCENDHGAYAYPRYWGMHVGYLHDQITTKLTLSIAAYTGVTGDWSERIVETYTSNTRQTVSFSMENPNEGSSLRDKEPRMDGGFFLFGYRCFDTGNPLNGRDFVRGLTAKVSGKFFRITIKDSNNTLKYDFKPKKQDGHIGMIDLVSNTFYPCNNDEYFSIGKED